MPFKNVLRSLPILDSIEESTKKVAMGMTQKTPPIAKTIEPRSIAPAAPPEVSAFNLKAVNARRNENSTHPKTVNWAEKFSLNIMSSISALKSGRVRLSEPAFEIDSLSVAMIATTKPVIIILLSGGIRKVSTRRKRYNPADVSRNALTNRARDPCRVFSSFQKRNEMLFLALCPTIDAIGSVRVISSIPIRRIAGSDFQ